MRRYTLLFSLLFSFYFSFAQETKNDTSWMTFRSSMTERFDEEYVSPEVIVTKPLIVVLFDEDKAVNPAEVKAYNDNMQELVPKCFTTPQKVLYKHLDEIKIIPKEEREEYNYLVYTKGMTQGEGQTGPVALVAQYSFYKKVDSPLKEKFAFDKKWEYCKLEIYTYNEKGNSYNTDNQSDKHALIIYTKILPHINPSKADLANWLMRSDKVIENKIAAVRYARAHPVKKTSFAAGIKATRKALKEAKNSPPLPPNPLLANKTLLICKADLNTKTNEASIKANYPFAFKVLEQAEIDEYILKKDPSCLVLSIVHLDAWISMYFYDIIDPVTSEIISERPCNKQVDAAFFKNGQLY